MGHMKYRMPNRRSAQSSEVGGQRSDDLGIKSLIDLPVTAQVAEEGSSSLLLIVSNSRSRTYEISNTRLPCKVLGDAITIGFLPPTMKCYRESDQRHCGQVEQGISNSRRIRRNKRVCCQIMNGE